MNGKKVYLVLARGGVYTQGPMQSFNFQDPYLRASLGFIGLNDIEVLTVEGIAFGPEVADKAVNAAWRECLHSPLSSLEASPRAAGPDSALYGANSLEV